MKHTAALRVMEPPSGREPWVTPERLDERLGRLQRIALIVGVVAVVLSAIGFVVDRPQFFHSFLLGYLFWLGMTLGCLALIMVHYLFGGVWGAVILRFAEASARVLPFSIVLFMLLALGIRYNYIWANPALLEHDEVARHAVHLKESYLNVPFFIVRAAVYFAIWGSLVYFLTRWSDARDRTADPAYSKRLMRLSGGGMVAFVLAVTWAGFDWGMSLTPAWFSGIYGAVFGMSSVAQSLAFIIICVALCARTRPLSDVMAPRRFNDLGLLLLTVTLVWTYFTLSQFLIIWMGNLPEETPWYLARITGGWTTVSKFTILANFAFAFVALLSRAVRQNRQRLMVLACILIVARFIDLIWVIMPAFYTDGFHIHWLDLVVPVAVGGLWLSLFLRNLRARPLLPTHDPYLEGTPEHA